MNKKALIAVGVAFVMMTVMLSLILLVGGTQAPNVCAPGATEVVGGGVVSGPIPTAVGAYAGEQLVNAAAVINAGAALEVSRRGQYIAVMTAMGESGLRVLDYGDSAGPDSRGLFQQRSGGAWGTLADRMDPTISATNFYRALLRVPGWEALPPTIAAHRTQINADPYYYEKYFDPAVEVVDALAPAGTAPESVVQVGTGGDPYGLGDVQPQLRAMVDVLAPRFGITTVGGYRPSAADPSGHPAGLAADFMVSMSADGRAQGQRLAEYAQRNASSLGVDYIIWYQRIWSTTRSAEGWRPMEDRGGSTENHLDHVHINANPAPEATGPNAEVETVMGPVSGSAATAAGCVSTSDVGEGAVVYPVADESSDRRNYGEQGALWAKAHTGTDFSVACGTPVYASHAGTVFIEASSWAGPQLVKISTGPASLTTWYAHLQVASVADGDVVAAGARIGEVGALGNATGCHLHFEVHHENGPIYGTDNVNPTTWLQQNVGNILGGAGTLTVVQANIKTGSSEFGASMGGVLERRPDLVSLNEVGSRSTADLAAAGYTTYRPWSRNNQTRSTAVLWRTDRWQRLDAGRIVLVDNGPQQYDAGRAATWVSLSSSDLGQVSMISTHLLINPARVGPNPLRQRLYAEAMGRLARLIRQLSPRGPVFVAGDFNSHFEADDPWGPRQQLAQAGMVSTYEELGTVVTQGRAATIDYTFYPRITPVAAATVRPERQWTRRINSDHRVIGTQFAITSNRIS